MAAEKKLYLIDENGHGIGPYESEADAEYEYEDGDEMMWLTADDFDAFGYWKGVGLDGPDVPTHPEVPTPVESNHRTNGANQH